MRRAVLVMGVMVGVLGTLTGCATSSERGTATYVGPSVQPTTPGPTPTPPPPQQVTTAITYFPTNFNPYSSGGGGSQTLDILSMLLPSTFVQQPSSDFQMNSDLLQNASVHTDKGHQSVEYKISDDAKWSDGTPITADDFEYLWKQINKTHSSILGGYDHISDVSEKNSDPKDVVVKFAKPFAEWQSLFDPLLPAHYLRQKGWDKGFQSNVPVTAGPFSVQSATPSQMVLTRDEHYFGEQANLEQLTIRMLPGDALASAVGAGQLDVAVNTDDTVRPANSLPDVAMTSVGAPDFDQVVLNTAAGPTKSQAVRRAIGYALNRSQIATASSSGGTPPKAAGSRMLIPGSSGYKDQSGSASYDPVRAKNAMKSAGYTYSGASAVKGGKPLQLRILAPSTDQRSIRIAEVIEEQLIRVGIGSVVNKIQPNLIYQTALPRGMFDLAVVQYMTTSQPAVDALYNYGCSQPGNFPRYCDHKADALIGQAVAAKDTASAANLLNQADARLWQEMPTIPLVQRQDQVIAAKKVTGVQYNSAAESLYWNAASWKVR